MKNIFALALVLCSAAAAAAENSKPIDVAVKTVNDRRTTGFFAQLAINIELPTIPATDVAASRVLLSSAVDDSGRSLLDPEAKEPELELNHRGSLHQSGDTPLPAAISVNLKNPDRSATKVKEVLGEIELYMPGKDPNSVAEIAKFMTFMGKPLAHQALKANGVELALVSAAEIEAEKKKRADAKRKEYADMGYSGEDLESMISSIIDSLLGGADENSVFVRIEDPNQRIQNISYIDAAGESQHVSVRDSEGIMWLDTWAGRPANDWKLSINMKTPKNIVRYAFALKDVPLP
jgi:hypothetical protein